MKKNRTKRIKAIKKELLRLVSLVVRARDNNKCIMCGRPYRVYNHHWWVRKGISVRLSYDPDNGATLCWFCHNHKAHGRLGDGLWHKALEDRMREIVGQESMDRMKEIAANPRPVGLEELEEARGILKGMVDGR